MLELKHVREIKGSITVPPSSDLLLLSMSVACALGRSCHISPAEKTPLISEWINLYSAHCSIQQNENSLQIDPLTSPATELALGSADIPYRDATVFTMLGAGKTIVITGLSPRITARFTRIAALAGCQLQIEERGESVTLKLGTIAQTIENKSGTTHIDDVSALVSLAMGSRRSVCLNLEVPYIGPLREMAPAFGCPITVTSSVPPKPTDPIARRIAAMQARRNPLAQIFKLEADFSQAVAGSTLITLPGDELLAALLYTAKSIVQKGTLTIENVPLESWAVQNLQLIRKMGCKLGLQESAATTFGSCGSVQLQRFTRIGRKVSCMSRDQFTNQIPAMVVLCAFAEGQSVIRDCAYLRDETPDAITQIAGVLKSLDVRHGEMPDGLVIAGAKQFDGFDCPQPLHAALAGAAVIAALRCRGTSTINDTEINKRWPNLAAQLKTICDFAD